jgi:hypothetical protein
MEVWGQPRPGRRARENEPPVPTEQEARWTPKSVWTFWRRKKMYCPCICPGSTGDKAHGREATTHFHVMSVAVPPFANVPSWRVALLNKGKCYWNNNCHNSGQCEMPYWSYSWMADTNISSCTSLKTLTQHNTIRLNKEHCTGVLLMQREYHTAQISYAKNKSGYPLARESCNMQTNQLITNKQGQMRQCL